MCRHRGRKGTAISAGDRARDVSSRGTHDATLRAMAQQKRRYLSFALPSLLVTLGACGPDLPQAPAGGRPVLSPTGGDAAALIGYVDGIAAAGDQEMLHGWACRKGSPGQLEVELWAGGPAGQGELVARFAANTPSEAAVAAACATTGNAFRYRIPVDRCLREVFGGKTLYVYPLAGGNRGPALTNSGAFRLPAPLSGAPARCDENVVEEVVTHWDRQRHASRFMATGLFGEGAGEKPRTAGTQMWWGTLLELSGLSERIYPYAFLPGPNHYRGEDFSLLSRPVYPLESRCLFRDICRDSGVPVSFLGANAWNRGAETPQNHRLASSVPRLQIVHNYRIYPTTVSERPADLFDKPGNNGTVSCHRFCENLGGDWGRPGTCVAGILRGVQTSCDTTPGLVAQGEMLQCRCTARYRKNLRGLVSVFLPPHWRADAPSGSYPIVLNGFYDTSENVLRQSGGFMARLIADSSKDGKGGAIGIIWNGGGAHTSFTVTPGAYDQFATIIDQAARALGGDRQRVLLYGGSRGGLTTMTMASNPDGKDYRVVHAAAAAPPPRLGQHLEMFDPTFPALLSISDQITGFAGSWTSGWRYPAASPWPGFSGADAREIVGRTMLGLETPVGDRNGDGRVDGADTVAWADANQSLLAPRMLAGLKAAGTEVSLVATSFDIIVPSVHQFSYYDALRRQGIPVEAQVYVRSGHTDPLDQVTGVGTLDRTQLACYRALQRVLRGQARPHISAGKLTYLQVDRAGNRLVPLEVPAGAFPFSLEFPHRVARGQLFSVVGIGTAGTAVRVLLEPEGGGEPGVFDRDAAGQALVLKGAGPAPSSGPSIGSFVLKTGFPATTAPGTYRIRVQLRRPGAASFVELQKPQVPGHLIQPATLQIVATEEAIAGSLHGGVAHTSLMELNSPESAGGSFRSVSWGISEY